MLLVAASLSQGKASVVYYITYYISKSQMFSLKIIPEILELYHNVSNMNIPIPRKMEYSSKLFTNSFLSKKRLPRMNLSFFKVAFSTEMRQREKLGY